MNAKKDVAVRNVEYGNKFFIDSYKLVNFNLNVPKYTQTVHWHDHFELEILDSGNAIHVINGESHALKQYDAYLVTPADVHTLHPVFDQEDPRVNITNISFNEVGISESVFNELMAVNAPLHVQFSPDVYEAFQYIAKLIKQTNATTVTAQRQLRQLCNYAVLRFLELYHNQSHVRDGRAQEAIQKESKTRTYINRALSYIKYNFRNPKLTTQKVAQSIFLSPNYFGELFYKHMGISCLDYIRKLKLNFAISLLRQSDITVAEISEKTGYTSTSYFIKEFKAEFGQTPQCYRLQLASENGSSEKEISKIP